MSGNPGLVLSYGNLPWHEQSFSFLVGVCNRNPELVYGKSSCWKSYRSFEYSRASSIEVAQ